MNAGLRVARRDVQLFHVTRVKRETVSEWVWELKHVMKDQALLYFFFSIPRSMEFCPWPGHLVVLGRFLQL